jgi:hypothetical protein
MWTPREREKRVYDDVEFERDGWQASDPETG